MATGEVTPRGVEVRGGDRVGPGTSMSALVLRECIMAAIGSSSAGVG